MSARDSGEATVSPSGTPADPAPARPSWEAAPPAPSPAVPRPAPAAPAQAPKPYYAAAPPPAPSAPAPPPLAAASQDEDVQYDLAGNPIASAGPKPSAYVPPAAGYPAGAGGVWPPQPTAPHGSPGGWQAVGDGTDRVAQLKWNWGAFLLPFWWCCFNGQKNLAWVILAVNAGGRYIPAPLSYILSVVDLGIRIYLGVMGHRLAWASGRAMGDYDDFIRTQRAWMIWGFVVDVVLVIGLAVLFSTMAGLAGSLGGGLGHAGHSGPAAP